MLARCTTCRDNKLVGFACPRLYTYLHSLLPLFEQKLWNVCAMGYRWRHWPWDSICGPMDYSPWCNWQYWELWTAFPTDHPWRGQWRGQWSGRCLCQRFLYVHWWVGLESRHLLLLFDNECPGSRVRAFGTCEASDLYSWECFVDNISIGSNSPTDVPENNWILCDSGSLADGPHNFTLRVHLYGVQFWFDQIQYVPSADMSLDSSLILVNASDSAIQYVGWQDKGRIVAWDMSYYTTLPNALANMTFDFNGSYLVLIGKQLSLQTLSCHRNLTQVVFLNFEWYESYVIIFWIILQYRFGSARGFSAGTHRGWPGPL